MQGGVSAMVTDTKAYTSQLYMTSGLKWENNNLFWRPPSLKLPARNKLGSLLTEALDKSVSFSACLCPLVRSLMFHCTLFSSLTCSVHQHLPQLLLITGMDEVKHTVSCQVELQWKEIYKYIFALHILCCDAYCQPFKSKRSKNFKHFLGSKFFASDSSFPSFLCPFLYYVFNAETK